MLENLCQDILSIIEDYADEKTIRLINKNVENKLKKYNKPYSQCSKCKLWMINQESSLIYDGCIYCSEKNYCHECNRYNYLNKHDACADYDCCVKFLCYDDCKFKCEICANIFSNVDDVNLLECPQEPESTNFNKKFICVQCDFDEQYPSPKLWWGISQEEYNRRYG